MKHYILLALLGFCTTNILCAQGVKPKQDIIEMYDASGKFNKIITFDYYEKVDEMPEFPGGKEGLDKYIQENLHVPEEANEAKLQGTVTMRFILSPTGNIMNIKTLDAPAGGNSLIKESQRLIKRMPHWKPGKLEGKPVYTEIIIPFVFKID